MIKNCVVRKSHNAQPGRNDLFSCPISKKCGTKESSFNGLLEGFFSKILKFKGPCWTLNIRCLKERRHSSIDKKANDFS